MSRIRVSRSVAKRVVLGGVLIVLAAGCSSSDWATRQAVSNLPKPPTTTPATTAPPAPSCTDARASTPALAPMPAPGAMPAGTTMAEIQRRGYLNVGIDQNTPGFSQRSPDGTQIVGFEYDLLRQVARAIFGDDNPDRLRPVALTTAERIPAVQSGKVDVAASLISYTCERQRQVSFSTDYFVAHQDLLVPTGSPITGTGVLGGRRVCATRGSTSLAKVTKLGAIPYPVASRADCLVALQDGRVDAITSDDTILAGFHQQDPTHTTVLGANIEREEYAMAIGHGHADLVAFVNGVLAQMTGPGCSRNPCLSDLATEWLAPLGITDPLPGNG